MRCKNCGWQNPEGLSNCERCSSALDSSPSSNMGQPHSDRIPTENSSPLRATVRETSFGGYQDNSSFEASMEQQKPKGGTMCYSCGYSLLPNMNVCPQCGKPQSKGAEANKGIGEKHCSQCGALLVSGTQFCPMCGQPQHGKRMQRNNRGTVNAWDNPQSGEFCSLRPIPWARENTEYSAISFSGERIVLNRANTDPNNQSITSHEQAVLTYDGRDWYIEDLSEQHSTMLRISRKTKLQSGDVIALGNRLFEFND